MATESDYRLPRNVLPRHYDITLEPDLEVASFKGSVAIDIEVVEATSVITLNAIELEIHTAVVRCNGIDSTGTISTDPEPERASVAAPA